MTTSPTPVSTGAPVAQPDDWVPADRRWAGFDRRTIGPALFVLAFALLMHFGLPGLDDAVDYDDPVVAGDVMSLSTGITFTPVAGWNIEKGVRVGDEPGSGAPSTASLSDGDVTYVVTTGPFDGDSEALIAQIKKTTDALNAKGDVHVVGDPVPITTDSGLEGMLVHYAGSSTEGVLGAFVVDGTGISVVATGSGTLTDQSVRDIASMIASLGAAEGSAS